MFSSLYSVYEKLKRPSTLFWLNTWSYSKNNTWLFLSNELLSFYIESIKGFKTITTTTFQLYPQILYKLILISLFLVQIGFIFG
jgi:hypothetical protein